MLHDMERGLNRIRVGFDRARQRFETMGKNDLAREVHWFEAKYTQAYLEGVLLPQALKIVQQAAGQGYHVVVASERSRKLNHRISIQPREWITLEELDIASGGGLKQVLPPVRNTLAALQAQFGDIADCSGDTRNSEERRALRNDFLAGRTRIMYTEYGPGAMALPLCDSDYPELGITGGARPRVSIFLSPPISGEFLKRAVYQTWGVSAKSDVHEVFLSTDSRCDMELMQQKIAPLLIALGASVIGEVVSVASQISTLNEEQRTALLESAISYGEGNSANVYATNSATEYVTRRNRSVPVQDWSQIILPPAESAKRKSCNPPGQRLGSEVRDQYFLAFGITQRSSYEEPVEVPTHEGDLARSALREEAPRVSSIRSNSEAELASSYAEAAEKEMLRLRQSMRNADLMAIAFLGACRA